MTIHLTLHAPASPRTKFNSAFCAELVRKSLLMGIASLVMTPGAWAKTSEQPQMALQRVDLTAGMYRIDAQVAQTPQERQTGLMHRKAMPLQEGMLFVFDEPSVQCFWMKNTLLPLTAAFVADDGTVVNLVDMKPQTTDSHCSEKPVRFVLEMNQGWFNTRAIKAGFRLTGPVFAKPAAAGQTR